MDGPSGLAAGGGSDLNASTSGAMSAPALARASTSVATGGELQCESLNVPWPVVRSGVSEANVMVVNEVM